MPAEATREELGEERPVAHHLALLFGRAHAAVHERLAQVPLGRLEAVDVAPDADAVADPEVAGELAREVRAGQAQARRRARGVVRGRRLVVEAEGRGEVLDALAARLERRQRPEVAAAARLDAEGRLRDPRRHRAQHGAAARADRAHRRGRLGVDAARRERRAGDRLLRRHARDGRGRRPRGPGARCSRRATEGSPEGAGRRAAGWSTSRAPGRRPRWPRRPRRRARARRRRPTRCRAGLARTPAPAARPRRPATRAPTGARARGSP